MCAMLMNITAGPSAFLRHLVRNNRRILYHLINIFNFHLPIIFTRAKASLRNSLFHRVVDNIWYHLIILTYSLEQIFFIQNKALHSNHLTKTWQKPSRLTRADLAYVYTTAPRKTMGVPGTAPRQSSTTDRGQPRGLCLWNSAQG